MVSVFGKYHLSVLGEKYMKKIVKIVWGASAPWYDEKAEAMQVRMSYLEF